MAAFRKHPAGIPGAAFMSEAARYSSPVLVLLAAGLLSSFVLPAYAAGTDSRILAAAITFDLTVVAPGLAYVLLVRTKRAPWVVILPIFAAGYGLAAATLPAEHHEILKAARFLIVPAELGVLAYLIVLARRALSAPAPDEGDFATRFRSVARQVLATRVPADILTTEVAILYHAFRRGGPRSGADSFTVHRHIGHLAITAGLILVLLVETTALHLLVRLWSSTVAWTLTGLSLYACIWLVGDYRALAARPLRITPTHLSLRVGLRWEADIPLSAIDGATPMTANAESPRSGTLVAALLRQPNLRLRLHGPAEVIGMYGMRRMVREIWLTVDEAGRFRARLTAAIIDDGTRG